MPIKGIPIPWFTRPNLLGRSRQIVTAFTRHGLSSLLNQLQNDVTSRRSLGRSSRNRRVQARHLRETLTELGVTFIKLGQMLSARPDLLPEEFIEELSKLQDDLPPQPFSDFEPTIVADLGKPVDQIYAEFDPRPVASASIGQVYAAKLHSGHEVVVKVRRPGVVETINQDLEIMADMADWAESHTAIGRLYDVTALVDEFSYTLRNELDYVREGHSADLFRRNFVDDPGLYIPKVYWEFTSARVITIERARGLKINDLEGMDRAGIDRRVVAENAVRLTLRELFEFGFFHADPHPGNFFVQPDGSLAIMDFGMMGRLNTRNQNALLRMAQAVIHRDADRMLDELVEVGISNRSLRRENLRRELEHLLDSYAGATLADVSATEVANEVMGLALRNGLQLPAELITLVRLITISEGLGVLLTPDFHMDVYVDPFVKKLLRAQRSPEVIVPRLAQATLEGMEFGLELPRQASRLLRQIERGQLEMKVNMEMLSDFLKQMQKMTNRLALAVLLAATIVALGLVMVVYHPQAWQAVGDYVFAFAFVSSLAFGAWLMFSIFRSGRT